MPTKTRPISHTCRKRIEREIAAEEAAARRRAEALAPRPATPPPVLASERPASLGVLGVPPIESQTGLHECAHAVVADLLGITVESIVRFGDGSGETRHDLTDGSPRECALAALGGAVVGDVAGWKDAVGIRGDLEVAREAAAELSPADPDAALERLTAEATSMVVAHLRVIGRLADVLERFGGRLAGRQVAAALDWAFERPAPMPVPGPRDHEVLFRFTQDRRNWQAYLVAELEDPGDEQAQLDAFWRADRLAREQEPPPKPRPTEAHVLPDPGIGSSSDAGLGMRGPSGLRDRGPGPRQTRRG